MKKENYIHNANNFINEDFEIDVEGDMSTEYAMLILDRIIQESKSKKIDINEVDIDSIIRKVVEGDDIREHEALIVDTLESILSGLYRSVNSIAKRY